MANRNFSMDDYFNCRAEERIPKLTFKGRTRSDWEKWRKLFYSKMIELCGEWPEQVPLKVDIIYSVDEGDFIRQKIVIDTEKHFSVPVYVLVPKNKDRARNGKLPAILCLHGHGKFGKEPVAGVTNKRRPEMEHDIKSCNYNYGMQMAQRGYLTICPDSRVFGELSDGEDSYIGRDDCNVHFLRGVLMGINLLTLNIWDMMKCIDYLETRRDVDPQRIGAMGLSWGGTRTTWISALDKRIKAADIICYIVEFKTFAIRDANFCGSQMLPHLYEYGDIADIAGLIAPRPLLVENGTYDHGFPIESCIKAHQHLKRIYHAAGATDKLHIDVFAGGHEFHGPTAFKFFDKYL
ncbi:alpha/beta hydrolase family protein [bacterium]|nr:alpha/beta hydrolase family protein [bacterium]